MVNRFEVGKFYGKTITENVDGLIEILANSGKTIKVIRTSGWSEGDSYHTTDIDGERRYKIYVDDDGDEYTLIDRFRSYRFEVWAKKISANPEKKDCMVYVSG